MSREDELRAYITARNTALMDMDVNWFMDTLRQNGHLDPDPFTVLVSMHKARYNIPAIPDSERHESAYWLRQRGFNDLHGKPLLPEGILPT